MGYLAHQLNSVLTGCPNAILGQPVIFFIFALSSDRDIDPETPSLENNAKIKA